MVNSSKLPSCGSYIPELLHSRDAVNSYFTNIAHKNLYDSGELDCLRCQSNPSVFQPLTRHDVKQLLRNVKPSAAGFDHIPAWLLRACSNELAGIVTHIIKLLLIHHPHNAPATPVPRFRIRYQLALLNTDLYLLPLISVESERRLLFNAGYSPQYLLIFCWISLLLNKLVVQSLLLCTLPINWLSCWKVMTM